MKYRLTYTKTDTPTATDTAAPLFDNPTEAHEYIWRNTFAGDLESYTIEPYGTQAGPVIYTQLWLRKEGDKYKTKYFQPGKWIAYDANEQPKKSEVPHSNEARLELQWRARNRPYDDWTASRVFPLSEMDEAIKTLQQARTNHNDNYFDWRLARTDTVEVDVPVRKSRFYNVYSTGTDALYVGTWDHETPEKARKDAKQSNAKSVVIEIVTEGEKVISVKLHDDTTGTHDLTKDLS